MAAASNKRSHHGTLVAGAEDVVTLTQRWDQVEVLNRHATGTLNVSVDNSAVSAANQAGTVSVPPNSGVRLSPVFTAAGTCIVRLFSAAAVDYSVTGF